MLNPFWVQHASRPINPVFSTQILATIIYMTDEGLQEVTDEVAFEDVP